MIACDNQSGIRRILFASSGRLAAIVAGVLWMIAPCSAEDPKLRKVEIEVSKETTHWTEPLDAHGRVDFVAIMNAIDGKGVTPEKNGFIPYFKLIRPLKGKLGLNAAYCKLLGMDPPSGDWPRFARHEAFGISPQEKNEMEEDRSLHKQYPKLASWINANLESTAILYQAADCPYFYVPEVHYDIPKPEDVFWKGKGSDFNPWMELRYLDQHLRLRAMLHLNEGNVDQAFSDILMRQRPMHAMMRQPSMMGRNIGCALASQCLQNHCVLLASTDLPARWYLDKASELDELPGLTEVEGLRRLLPYGRAASLRDLEDAAEGRPSSLDYILFFDGLLDKFEEFGMKREIDHALVKEARRLADWSEVFRAANRWYDRLETEAGAEARYRDAMRAVYRVVQEAEEWKKSTKPPAKGALSREAATDFLSRFAVPSIPDSIRATLELNEIADCTLRMVRISYRLAAWRADHNGRYPESLDALVPKYTEALPADPFTGKPFGYHTVKNGYVLHSPGPSGTYDDPELGFTRRLGTYNDEEEPDKDLPVSMSKDEDNIGLIIRHE